MDRPVAPGSLSWRQGPFRGSLVPHDGVCLWPAAHTGLPQRLSHIGHWGGGLQLLLPRWGSPLLTKQTDPSCGGDLRGRHFVWGLFPLKYLDAIHSGWKRKRGVPGCDPLFAALLCSYVASSPTAKLSLQLGQLRISVSRQTSSSSSGPAEPWE